MRRALFTVIVDYAGGTYVAQARAKTVDDLSRDIDDVLPFESMKPIPRRKRFDSAIGEPTQLEGLKNAWCLSGTIGRRFVIVNIVRTEG